MQNREPIRSMKAYDLFFGSPQSIKASPLNIFFGFNYLREIHPVGGFFTNERELRVNDPPLAESFPKCPSLPQAGSAVPADLFFFPSPNPRSAISPPANVRFEYGRVPMNLFRLYY